MRRNSAKRPETSFKNPPHIAGFIRREIIEPLELTVTAAAQALGISRPTLSNLINGGASLSWDMAFRIEKAFGPKADHLMRMQFANYEAQARARQGSIKVNKIICAPQP
ncbi:MAG: addiction module antidote protein, HigA family [Hyphomicrobium sp.]|nr:MAG: addiction module antidote protein, HigA family [Hyphomicrobium sp.]